MQTPSATPLKYPVKLHKEFVRLERMPRSAVPDYLLASDHSVETDASAERGVLRLTRRAAAV